MQMEHIDLILEFSGLHEKVETKDANENTTEFYLSPGIKYDFGHGFEAGVAVPVGLNDDSADWGVMARINKTFEVGSPF